jgi:hypothetical protein
VNFLLDNAERILCRRIPKVVNFIKHELMKFFFNSNIVDNLIKLKATLYSFLLLFRFSFITIRIKPPVKIKIGRSLKNIKNNCLVGLQKRTKLFADNVLKNVRGMYIFEFFN